MGNSPPFTPPLKGVSDPVVFEPGKLGQPYRILTDVLPLDVWFLIFARLRPRDIARVYGVSSLWRYRAKHFLTSSHPMRPLSQRRFSDELLSPHLELKGALGFAHDTGHAWVMEAMRTANPREQLRLVEYDMDLRRIGTHPLELPQQPYLEFARGVVSIDSTEALLMYRSYKLRYPSEDIEYFLCTVSLKTFEQSKLTSVLRFSYVDEQPPVLTSRIALQFTSRLAIFAHVHSEDHDWCSLLRRSENGLHAPKRILLNKRDNLHSVALLTADSFLYFMQEYEGTTRYAQQYAMEGGLKGKSALHADLSAISCNMVLRGAFAYAHTVDRFVAVHKCGAVLAFPTEWRAHYVHVHVRYDGAVMLSGNVGKESFGVRDETALFLY